MTFTKYCMYDSKSAAPQDNVKRRSHESQEVLGSIRNLKTTVSQMAREMEPFIWCNRRKS